MAARLRPCNRESRRLMTPAEFTEIRTAVTKLGSEASWQAADMCRETHGGFGFAEEYDVERKFRETRFYQVAPISTNLVLSYLAEHVLGLQRSY